MGDCHLDDLLDILDQDDDFEEDVTSSKPQTLKTSAGKNNENVDARSPETDPEKEALKRKLQEMEKQMKMIKSQLGSGQTPDDRTNKTITEVDIFSSNSTVDNKHLRSPVKVSASDMIY